MGLERGLGIFAPASIIMGAFSAWASFMAVGDICAWPTSGTVSFVIYDIPRPMDASTILRDSFDGYGMILSGSES